MISVIIPIYNVEKYIRACLEAVINQKCRDFELILIDDGATDNSIAIAEDVLKKLSDVPHEIIRTKNRGVSCARNEGVKRAKGEFIVMVDSDDIISPDFLSDYVKMIHDNANADLYSSGFTVFAANTNERLTPEPQSTEVTAFEWNAAQRVFFGRTVKFLLPTLLFRKSFLTENSITFDEEVRYSEDVQYIWRCLAFNRKMVIHTAKSNYDYMLHPGSTMTASRLPKIMTCVGGLEKLYDAIQNKLSGELQDAFLPRMYFSLLHSAAKIITFKDFLKLYREAGCKKYIQAESKFGSLKTKAVSRAMLISMRIGYLLMGRF